MDTILGILAGSSVRIIVIAILMACIQWGMRIKSPTIQHRAWTGVLISMLLLPFLSLWIPKIPLPFLPAYSDMSQQQSAGTHMDMNPRSQFNDVDPRAAIAIRGLPTSIKGSAQYQPKKRYNGLGLTQLAGIFYLVGLCTCVAKLLLGMFLARRLGRRVVPDARGFYIAQCNVPLTLGLLRPRILMPTSVRQWDEKRLSSVLVHEREHVRRCDPMVEWLTLVNRSIFWFHPLSWWLRRHLTVLAEQACDEAVIAHGSDPESYTELLLDLARSVNQKGILDPNWGSSIQGGALMKRIQNILAGGSGPRISRFRLGFISALCIAVILVPLTCQLIPAEQYPSQNAVYLVSKGISAEEDEGNLDVALAYYREVLTAPSDQKVYSAFAQYRIAQILLQKGKLAEAAQEFDVLARIYPEYSDLVGIEVSQDQSGVFHGKPSWQNSMRPIGTIRDNRYRHSLSGAEFSLQNWTVAMESSSSGGGEMVILQKEDANALQAKVWMKPERSATADIPSRLRGSLQEKVLQRLSARGYRIRPDSIQLSAINGKQALFAIADYVERNNAPMTEYLAWIYTERTRVFFLAHSSTSEFQTFKSLMDQLVATAVVP